MTSIQMKLLLNDVERVLHVPGNLVDGKLTEMTIVLDYKLSKEQLCDCSTGIVVALKRHGELFQNVRLNVVKWISDEEIVTEILPLAMLGIGRGFEDYSVLSNRSDKNIEELAGKLKLFHARSKLIILVSDGKWQISDEKLLQENLQPFLHKKWIWVDTVGDSKGRVSKFVI